MIGTSEIEKLFRTTPAQRLKELTQRAKQVCFNEGVLSGRLPNELMKEAAAKRERKQAKRLNDVTTQR